MKHETPTPLTDAFIGDQPGVILTPGAEAMCDFARDLERENSRLLSIILRAETKFFEEGSDGAIAEAMFTILSEARKTTPQSPRHTMNITEQSTPDDGGPAFPCSIDPDGGWYNKEANGMTLRDWFAGQALANASLVVDEGGTVETAAKELGIETEAYDYRIHWPMLSARRAYAYADDMIAERKGRQQ